MEAKDILKQMARAYAEAETYQDTGSLTVSKDEIDGRESLVNFKTYFKRPNYFRFETMQPKHALENHFVLWCDGKKVARQSNNYTQQLSEHFLFRNTLKDLDRALSNVREAQPTAGLLLDKLTFRKMTDLQNIKYINSEAIGAQNCYHLQSENHHELIDYWISTSAYNIVRLVEKQLISDNEETLKVSSQPKFAKKVPIVYDFQYKEVVFNANLPTTIFDVSENKK